MAKGKVVEDPLVEGIKTQVLVHQIMAKEDQLQLLLEIAEEEERKKLLSLRSLIQSLDSSLISKLTKISSMCTSQKTLRRFKNGKPWYHQLFRFKRLSLEERVNALSTVCPHLIEIFTTMYTRE